MLERRREESRVLRLEDFKHCGTAIGCIRAITRNSPELVIGQVICDESSDMRAHAVSEHVYVLRPRASRMIPQVFHQLRDAPGAEIRAP